MPFNYPFSSGPTYTVLSNDLLKISHKDKNYYKFFFKFEDLPLIDEINDTEMIFTQGADKVFLTEGAFGKGLRLKPLSIGRFFVPLPSTLDSFSLGFWLNPINVKPSVEVSTGQIKYYKMALFDKSNFFLDSSQNVSVITDESSFAVYEECLEDNMNKLYVLLQGVSDKIIVSSSPYVAGTMHYFWISYSGYLSSLKIFIDGLEVTTNNELGTDIPSSLNNDNSVPFHVNNSAVGYNALIRGNFGLLDELIFTTEYVIDSNILSKHINFGSEYSVYKNLVGLSEISQSFVYDDPTTIDIKAVASNGKNIYAGKSDGNLYKGDRLMWQSRKDFSQKDEIKLIKKNKLSTESIIDSQDGYLKIYKSSIRI